MAFVATAASYVVSGAGTAATLYSSLPFAVKAGTMAIGTSLATPMIIPAAVGALGFGTGGIAAGSTAATWMSLGQGVTPYVVSVCQSIGATGAVAGATQVATGGLVAAGAFAAKALLLF